MRRMTKARVKFISLVPKGANRLPVVYKADGAFQMQMLCKDMTDKGELTAVVYAPEFRDSQGDIASADVIKDMAYAAAKEGVEIDVRHDGKPVGKDKAFIAESFIVQKGDSRFTDMADYDGNPVDVTGAWGVVLKIEDEELKTAYRANKWNGVSLGGSAATVTEKLRADQLIEGLAKHLQTLTNPPVEENMALTKEEMSQIAKEVADLIKTKPEVKPPVKPEVKPPVTKEDDTPKFEGEVTVENLKKHQEALKAHDLRKRLEKATKPSEVEEILKEMEAKPGKADDGKPGDTEKDAKIAALNKEIADLEGSSNQPGAPAADLPEGMTKEMSDRFAKGNAAAKAQNVRRGYSVAK